MKPCVALLRRSARFDAMQQAWDRKGSSKDVALLRKGPAPDIDELQRRAEVERPQRATAYARTIGHRTHGAMLNKVDTHSIEAVKYGTRNELADIVEDAEGALVPARDVPQPVEQLMSIDSRYGALRRDAVALTKLPTTKTQLAITYANPYHIPDVLRGTDQCPGCGALMQCREQFAPGYTSLLDIKLHIERHDRQMKLRERYYSRQARLHETMKEAGGFQEGMEYQDYITQEEMEAVHQYQPEPIVCEKCRHIQSYTYDSKKAIMPMDEWRTELAEVKQKNAMIVVVVSLWDFEGTWPVNLADFVGHRRVLLIGTHGDCIPRPWERRRQYRDRAGNRVEPKQVSPAQEAQWEKKNLGQLGMWMRQRAADKGVNVYDAIAIGNDLKMNIDVAAAAIQHFRKGRDVYLMGCVNVGKSSFVSNLYERFRPNPRPHPAAEWVTDVVTKGKHVEYVGRWQIPEEASAPEKAMSMTLDNPFTKSIATVTDMPGSTLKNMAFTIHAEGDAQPARIVDTPGIVQRGHLVNVLPLGLVSMLTPKRRMGINFFKVLPGYSLYLGSLVRVDVVKGPENGLMLKAVGRWNRLTGNVLPTHESDIFYEKWKGVRGVMAPPTTRSLVDEIGPPVDEKVFYLEGSRRSETHDICIHGVAFFNVAHDERQTHRSDIVLRVTTVRGLEVSKRPSMLHLRNAYPSRRTLTRRKRSKYTVEAYLLHLAAERQGLPYPQQRQRYTRVEEEDDEDDDEDIDL